MGHHLAMNRLPCLLVAAFALAAGGCALSYKLRPRPDPMEIPGTVAAPGDLQNRLTAAREISSVNLRDQTLAALAGEAANSAYADLIQNALNAITSVNLRDATAAQCALRLALKGRPDLGMDLARLIQSQNLRDQTLASLATGK
jgi:hypothetical protein